MTTLNSFTQVQSHFPLRVVEIHAAQVGAKAILLKFTRTSSTLSADQSAFRSQQTRRRAGVSLVSHHAAVTQRTVMQLTIDARCLTQLRQLVMSIGGGMVVFMRAQPFARAARMKVWLCVHTSIVNPIMEAVMRALPYAEFGHFPLD